jgi:hypothetical protein
MIARLVNYFFHCFIGCSLGVLLNDFFDRRHPDEYKIVKNHLTNLIVNVSYNSIYFYSKCQIWFIKHVATNPYYLKLLVIIETMKSSSCNNSINVLDLLYVKDNFHINVPCESPDLIIATDLSKMPALKKIVYNKTINDSDIIFEESTVKFMIVNFKVGENSYKIDLKTDEYNYYLIGNEFTKDFFIFYINQHILSKYEQHETNKYEKYSLKFLDQNVNMIEIDFTDKNESILIEKTDYKLQ